MWSNRWITVSYTKRSQISCRFWKSMLIGLIRYLRILNFSFFLMKQPVHKYTFKNAEYYHSQWNDHIPINCFNIRHLKHKWWRQHLIPFINLVSIMSSIYLEKARSPGNIIALLWDIWLLLSASSSPVPNHFLGTGSFIYFYALLLLLLLFLVHVLRKIT